MVLTSIQIIVYLICNKKKITMIWRALMILTCIQIKGGGISDFQILRNDNIAANGSTKKRRWYSRARDKIALHPRKSTKKVTPTPLPRHHKYSGKNSFFNTSKSHCLSSIISPSAPKSELNTAVSTNLQKILSTGLSDSSWGKYRTALNHLKATERETGRDMSLPLREETVLWYVSFLSTTRDVTAKTTEGYLDGLKMIHLAMGIHIPSLKSPLVKLALKGHDKVKMLKSFETVSSKPHRRAITLELLKFFVNFLHEKITSSFNLWAYYALAVVAFFGSFRMGELISKRAGSFDPCLTLLNRDVGFTQCTLKENEVIPSVSFLIKSPKVERPGRGQKMELISISDPLDPVSAISKYNSMKNTAGLLDPGMPFFVLESGACIHSDALNRLLRQSFSPLLDEKDSITNHSFRAGLVSHMREWNFSELEIKMQGRWTSSAWELYCKLPSSERRDMTSKLAKKFSTC